METPTILKKNIDNLLIKSCINNYVDLFRNTLIKFIIPNLYNRNYLDCIHKYLNICYIKGNIQIIQIIYDLIPRLKNFEDEQTKINILYRISIGGNTDCFRFFFNLCHEKNIDITVDNIKNVNNGIIYTTVKKNYLELFKEFFRRFPDIFNEDSLVEEIFIICCTRKYNSFVDYLIEINLHNKLTRQAKESCFKKAYRINAKYIIHKLLKNINYSNEIETIFDYVISNDNNISFMKDIIKFLALYISNINHPRKDYIFNRIITIYPDFLISQ